MIINIMTQDEDDDDDEEEEEGEEPVKTHEQYIQGEAEEDAQLAWELFEVRSVTLLFLFIFHLSHKQRRT